ncbi:MAG: hypothetical protein HYY26_05335 [Acidobacteria bacterium]|nr:hypothetical protein [Acidobacteriota bacterium]
MSAGAAEPAPNRYRVEQVIRLETTTAQGGDARPMTTVVEGRVRFLLEQELEASQPGYGSWRFTQVEVSGPRTEPPERADPGVERALVLGLDWMRRLEGQHFSGSLSDVPVIPLGEPAPPWLTEWLRWAQTGSFAGVEANPVAQRPPDGSGEPPVVYEVRWVRREFRQQPCHVQQARWATPVRAAPGSLSASLASEGVEARSYFAGHSLEWVAQEAPALIYAERSAARETFWSLEKVQKPELQGLVFRLRLAVEVRVERLP